jgi:aromatic-L-amino-acid decarboxylase
MSIPLEPDKRDRDELSEAVLAYLDDWYQRAADMPASGEEYDPDLSERLGAYPGEEGRAVGSILDDLDIAGQSGIFHLSGGHLSYIPNGGLYSGALADLLAAGLNRYTGVANAAPGMSAIEHGVVDWMLSLFELGDNAAGVLLSGGSTANFTGVVAARTAQLGDNFGKGVIYVSPNTHHSVAKSARLAGIIDAQIREVPVDRDLKMRPDALTDVIRHDRDSGLKPFLVVGSAGTTDTGTVDPLDSLAEIAAEEGLWFHVDAAYGGFYQMTDRGKATLAGISRADSIALDPHKGLSIPFGVGALLVREEAHLIDANRGRGAYLRDEDQYMGLQDISSLGPELSRPNRGLLVWLPLQLHGLAAFREALEATLDLAAYGYERLTEINGIDALWKPDLSVVAFRFDDDDIGREALRKINEDRKVHLSPTTVEGRFVLRFAIVNRRTNRAHIDHAIDIIEKTLAGWPPSP